jgi:hypothetical protein
MMIETVALFLMFGGVIGIAAALTQRLFGLAVSVNADSTVTGALGDDNPDDARH